MATAQQAAGDTDSYTVNPNITEGDVSTVSTWVEMLGQVPNPGPGTTDVQWRVDVNSTTGSGAYTDASNKTTFDYLYMENSNGILGTMSTKTFATGENNVYALTVDATYVYAGLYVTSGKVVRI